MQANTQSPVYAAAHRAKSHLPRARTCTPFGSNMLEWREDAAGTGIPRISANRGRSKERCWQQKALGYPITSTVRAFGVVYALANVRWGWMLRHNRWFSQSEGDRLCHAYAVI